MNKSILAILDSEHQTETVVSELQQIGIRTKITLLEAGQLKSITSHGELDLPDDCFVRIPLPDRLLTYGLGLPLRRLMRDPLHAAGVTERVA